MPEHLMADKPVCRHQVTHDGWHFMKCGKPAKFIVVTASGLRLPKCGIHVRSYRRRLGSGLVDRVEAL